MITYITGDLLEEFEAQRIDILVHGCNCFHTMGAGIAKQIKQKYNQAYMADLQTNKGTKSKMGTYSIAQINRTQSIVNAYTQHHFYGKQPVDYEAIRRVFRSLNRDFQNKTIGFPKIGAGLAKGDWSVIETIIEEECASVPENNNRYICVLLQSTVAKIE